MSRRPDPFLSEPGLPPSKLLARLIATRIDEHGESHAKAREAVVATARGKELLAQSRAEFQANVRPPRERIEELVAAKWAEMAPNAGRPPLVVRYMSHAPLLIAHVDGLPPRLRGLACPRRQQGEPPLIIIQHGMPPELHRLVLCHEIAHLIFDSQLMRDAHEDREARADEVGCLILETLELGKASGTIWKLGR